MDSEVMFALVRRSESPGKGSIQLRPGIFVAINENAVDRVIAEELARNSKIAADAI